MGELIFIGLGLYDEEDITLKGLKEAKKCDVLFAEFYTAQLTGTTQNKLEKLIGKDIIVLDRKKVEQGDMIIKEAEKKKVALLTAGEPMAATTHIALRLRAVEKGIKTKIVHGISIVTAASSLLGLQQYKFGKITTVPFPQENYFPLSPYDVIKENKESGLHTLVLLDIQKERWMSANEGIKILLKMEEQRKEGVITEKTLVCVVARASSSKAQIRADYAKNLLKTDFGGPMHCLVIPGELHFMEARALIALAKAPKEIEERE